MMADKYDNRVIAFLQNLIDVGETAVSPLQLAQIIERIKADEFTPSSVYVVKEFGNEDFGGYLLTVSSNETPWIQYRFFASYDMFPLRTRYEHDG